MRISILMLYLLCFSNCNDIVEEEQHGLFEPDLISTDLYEFSSTFYPDGNLFFYTLSSPNYYIYEFTIVYSKKVNGKWTTPEVAPFSGMFSDRDPYFSPDGNYLYFSSKRPVDASPKNDFDLWRVAFSYDKFQFGAPENLGININSSLPQISPAVDIYGNLYYSSAIEGNTMGSLDIYKSEWKDNEYKKPLNLGDSINSSGPDAYPFILPDGNKLFFSSRRQGGFGDMDIYISELRDDLVWGGSKQLDSTINSNQSDISPFVFDGYLYFSSTKQMENISIKSIEDWNSLSSGILNGNSNIYRIIKSDLLIN